MNETFVNGLCLIEVSKQTNQSETFHFISQRITSRSIQKQTMEWMHL